MAATSSTGVTGASRFPLRVARSQETKEVIIQRTFSSGSYQFTNPAEMRRMEEIARKSEQVVCQIRTPNSSDRGTGCLIGGNLLITNHHVLRDEDTARNSIACFFQIMFQNSQKNETHVKMIKIPLAPDSYFFSGGPDLDFTIVALQIDPYLSTVQNKVFNLFKTIIPREMSPVLVLQCPEVVDAETLLKGDLKSSWGHIREIRSGNAYYDAPTLPGSSGGAVIGGDGCLIALHRAREITKNADGSIYKDLGEGILCNNIGTFLEGFEVKRAEMEKWLKVSLPPPPINEKIINLPLSNKAFTGREKELELLHQLLLEKKRIAVTGLGGIGKTSLVTKYANEHQEEYRLICFIPSTLPSQVEKGLLNLADELTIANGTIEQRLLLLKTKLENNEDPILLIFDGVDDEKTLAYINQNSPQQGHTHLLLASRLKQSTQNLDFYFDNFPLQNFTKEEAVAYLLNAVNVDKQRDANEQEAANLAFRLGHFPLALAHAAAYIRSQPGYTFNAYTVDLGECGLELFEEQIILTTWNKSIEAIRSLRDGHLAEKILQFISVLGPTPIPREVIERYTKAKKFNINRALGHLENYSLLSNSSDGCSVHPLVQQVICYQMGEEVVRSYCSQAIEIFYELLGGMIPRSPHIRRILDPYIPHLLFLINKLIYNKAIKLNMIHFNTLLDIIWGYYYHDGKYERSKVVAEGHLGKIKAGGETSTLQIAECLDKLGMSLCGLGNYNKAIGYQLEALKIREEFEEENQLLLASSYNNLAVSFLMIDMRSKSATYLTKSLELSKKLLGKSNSRVAVIYVNLGCLAGFERDFNKAIKYHGKALEIRRGLHGEINVDTALCYCNLGLAYIASSCREDRIVSFYEDDEDEVWQALLRDFKAVPAGTLSSTVLITSSPPTGELIEDEAGGLGGHQEEIDPESTTGALSSISGLKSCDPARTTGDFNNSHNKLMGNQKKIEISQIKNEGLSLQKKSLEIQKELFKEKHVDMITTYRSIGWTLDFLGRTEEAVEYHKQAFEISLELLGELHPITSQTVFELEKSYKTLIEIKDKNDFILVKSLIQNFKIKSGLQEKDRIPTKLAPYRAMHWVSYSIPNPNMQSLLEVLPDPTLVDFYKPFQDEGR